MVIGKDGLLVWIIVPRSDNSSLFLWSIRRIDNLLHKRQCRYGGKAFQKRVFNT